MKRALGVALLCVVPILLTGCSSDPTPKDFERFARDYASKATREKIDTDGDVLQITCELVRHDLRKTDSLTSPFVGEAEFKVTYAGDTIRHMEFPEGKKGSYVNRLTLGFNWVGGEWQHAGGTTQITDIIVPGMTPEQAKKAGKLHSDNSRAVTRENSESLFVGITNGWSILTEDEIRNMRLSDQ